MWLYLITSLPKAFVFSLGYVNHLLRGFVEKICVCLFCLLFFQSAASSSTAASQSKSVGVKIPTCKISLKDTFLTSPEELYRVFVTQEVMPGLF